jgi:hypothetical protein
MDAQHPQIAHHLLHGVRSGGRLRVHQELATIGVDKLTRDAGGFLRLALGVTIDRLKLPPEQPAAGVDAVDF